MDAHGVTIRTIRDMTGHTSFNEVFFDEVRIPQDNLVGKVGDGWEVAKATLGNERVSLSSEGLMWGAGPTVMDIIDLVSGSGNALDMQLRHRLAEAYVGEQILRLTRLRIIGKAVAGQEKGPEVSIIKALSDAHGKSVMNLAVDIAGTAGMLREGDPLCRLVGWEQGHGRTWGKKRTLGASDWMSGFLFSPALTIGGGTAEIQRNIIAENALGLPRD
jgi:alkylation response protein AidB-like acyl-CoA dehydrogenase